MRFYRQPEEHFIIEVRDIISKKMRTKSVYDITEDELKDHILNKLSAYTTRTKTIRRVSVSLRSEVGTNRRHICQNTFYDIDINQVLSLLF